MASVIISAIVLATSLPFLTVQTFQAIGDDARLVRDFSDPIRTIVIENLAGPTEIRVWSESVMKLSASRPSSPDNSRIEAEVLIERPEPGTLKIVANPDSLFRPITLTLTVPSAIQISVRGGTERVTVKGQPASLSVETKTGSVTIHLPQESNTDVSLRSLRGIVEARVPVTVFGQADEHVFDGRIGNGGSPVIARSQRGNITIRSEGLSWSASTSQQPQSSLRRDLASSAESVADKRPLTGSADTPAAGADRIAAGEDVIKLEARLVNLNVKVTDAAGKTLPALRKETSSYSKTMCARNYLTSNPSRRLSTSYSCWI